MPPQLQRRHGLHASIRPGREMDRREREWLLREGGHGAHLDLQLWAGRGTERRLRESLLLWAGRVNHDLQQRMGYCPGRAGFSSSRRGCSLGQHLLLVDRKAPLVIAPL